MNSLLHSQIMGEGRPLIILHGFLGMGDNWKTLGKQFALEGFQVHLVDQRNHGRSLHANEFSYELMAKDLHEYIMHHSLEECSLLGHSMGGKTAMRYAVDHPQTLSHLIIADIGPKAYPQHHQDILKALGSLDFSELKTRGQADEFLSVYIKDMGTRLFLLKNLYWKEKGKLDLRINLPVLSQNIAEIGKELPIDAHFEGKALFIRGANSGYIEDMDMFSIRKQFPNAILQTVENAGHWLHADNPTQFFELTLSFLKKS